MRYIATVTVPGPVIDIPGAPDTGAEPEDTPPPPTPAAAPRKLRHYSYESSIH